ncbi:MAG: DUF2029 domain-containing protein [Deltaproteobacteria bacterium]|nr:DUF2029 domain-containing protein [Deltaproteobacteria bacterium]MBI3390409.1 DUF2029 domain-containing protein [Deltaproteobacteria bacterium]
MKRGAIAEIAAVGVIIHVATAMLRLDAFWPYPKQLDFVCDYVGAWAIRVGVSPYQPPPEFLATLRANTALALDLPFLASAPIVPWLVQPFTFVNYPAAATAWLLLSLGLTAWSARELARIADTKHTWAVFVLVLTFGPVFLTLTLGQNSLFLLVAVLAVAQALKTPTPRATMRAALLFVPPVGFKLFPLLWLGALPLLQRWRLLLSTTTILITAFGISTALTPTASREYWGDLLPLRLTGYLHQPTVDDQSLTAWFERIGRPQELDIQGLSVDQLQHTSWSPPWSVDRDILRGAAIVLSIGIGALVSVVMWRTPAAASDGAFYLWVLCGLVAIPHAQRYDHVVMLPAMAWLWARGGTARRSTIIAYTLAGFARLTHLWALLPAPWGPLASGVGLASVLVLGTAMLINLRRGDPPIDTLPSF